MNDDAVIVLALTGKRAHGETNIYSDSANKGIYIIAKIISGQIKDRVLNFLIDWNTKTCGNA